ncbi:MAG: hypothetical protein Q8K97_17810 [Pseudohongiella sp.]|nr:hypothetical protein [Pseudohongiella sp.]
MKSIRRNAIKSISISSLIFVSILTAAGAEASLDMLCRGTYKAGTFNNTTFECLFTWSSLDETIYPDGLQSALATAPGGLTWIGDFPFNAPSQAYNAHDVWLVWSTPGMYSIESWGNLSFSWVSGENPNITETITYQPEDVLDDFSGLLP